MKIVEALEGAVVLDKTEEDIWLCAMLIALAREFAEAEPAEMSPSEENATACERGRGSKSLQSTSVSDLATSGSALDLSKLTSEIGNSYVDFFLEGDAWLVVPLDMLSSD